MIASPSQPPIEPGTPQVLLFGHSGAGKSALLGALYQAGEKQGEILLGELLEPSGRLSSLRDATYSGIELERTHAELVTYIVRLRPWRVGTRALTDAFTVVLNDCSGKAAESLIRHPDSLRDPETRAPVVRAVIDADAILLLVDAAVDESELAAAFVEFNAFLKIVGAGKAMAREVGGFPVFLVLTHCDKLALATDTRASWDERLRTRAESAWVKFHDFLQHAAHEDEGPSPFLPFGSIELMVATVAIRTPRLVDAPGQPSLPDRVAELFRDCFAAARLHQQRVKSSNNRLRWTLRVAVSFVATLLLGSLGVALFQPPSRNDELMNRVLAYQLHEQPAAVRLAEPQLSQNKRILTSLEDDPTYYALPSGLKEFVESRLKEIADYERYREQLETLIPPSETRTLEELTKLEHALRGELALPSGYNWEETAAGALRDKYLGDIQAIRKTEAEFLQRYQDLIRRGIALTLTNSFAENWRSDVGGLLAEGIHTPATLNEPLKDSKSIAVRHGEAVLNRVPYEFERVYQARKDWESTSERITHLRDLADALGLTSGPKRPEPFLVLPEPGPGIDAATLPAARWNELILSYPYLTLDENAWNLQNFPDPGRTILSERLDRCFKTSIRLVQSLILARLGPNWMQSDTPEGWRKLATALTDATTPFPICGPLLHVYVQLRNPSGANPVLELAAFLRTPSFEFNLRGFDLVIPVDLALEKLTPNGPLTVTTTRRGEPGIAKRFNLVDDGVRSGSTTAYRLAIEGDGKLTYLPGDGMRAEMPVRSGTQEFKIIWEPQGTRTYQFDLFDREPRLVKNAGSSEPAVGVKLTPSKESILPRIPALFPELRR